MYCNLTLLRFLQDGWEDRGWYLIKVLGRPIRPLCGRDAGGFQNLVETSLCGGHNYPSDWNRVQNWLGLTPLSRGLPAALMSTLCDILRKGRNRAWQSQILLSLFCSLIPGVECTRAPAVDFAVIQLLYSAVGNLAWNKKKKFIQFRWVVEQLSD